MLRRNGLGNGRWSPVVVVTAFVLRAVEKFDMYCVSTVHMIAKKFVTID